MCADWKQKGRPFSAHIAISRMAAGTETDRNVLVGWRVREGISLEKEDGKTARSGNRGEGGWSSPLGRKGGNEASNKDARTNPRTESI